LVARPGVGHDLGEATALDGQPDAPVDPVRQLGVLAPERPARGGGGVRTDTGRRAGHGCAPARSVSTVARTCTPAMQSSDVANSSGECEMPVGLRTKSIAVGTPALARIPAS